MYSKYQPCAESEMKKAQASCGSGPFCLERNENYGRAAGGVGDGAAAAEPLPFVWVFTGAGVAC